MESNFIINERPVVLDFDPRATLLDTLRAHGYTEVKKGCAEGMCGSCLVLLEDKPVNACQVLTATIVGQRITTIAGLGDIHHPHLIQQAFVETGAVQCGFCTPGMVLASYALLTANTSPTEAEICAALDGNLCRCTGYVKIIEAVKLAARRMAEHD
ncbi:(2Fe-2S)-binding protein [bacterium]|nr:(2Fe-2S)-binding protein [bacterium]